MKNIILTAVVLVFGTLGIFAQKSAPITNNATSCCCPQTPVYVSGRIQDEFGAGLRNITVNVVEISLDGTATVQSKTITNSFGYYLVTSHTCEWTAIVPNIPRGGHGIYSPQSILKIITDYYTIQNFVYISNPA